MNYERKIINFFAIMPFIDTLNGFALQMKIPLINKIGILYRFLLLVYVIYFILKNNKYRLIIMPLMMLFLSYPLIHAFCHSSFVGLIQDINKISKLGMILILPIYFITITEIKKNSVVIIREIFNKLIIYFPITIIIPYIFNVGNSLYSNGAGFKGFYFANNDITIVLLIMSVYSLDIFLNNLKIKQFIVFGLNVFSLLITGTKTGILGVIIIILIFMPKILKLLYKQNKRIIIYFVFFLLLGATFINPIKEEFSLSQERNNYFIQNGVMNKIDVLFGGRTIFLKDHFLQNDITIKNFLLGDGEYKRSLDFSKYLIEMDLFDTIFLYGIPFTFIVYYQILKSFMKLKKKFKNENFKISMSFLIMMGFSLTAGHVLYSGLSGTIFALIIAQFKVNNLENRRSI